MSNGLHAILISAEGILDNLSLSVISLKLQISEQYLKYKEMGSQISDPS
jgi:hypothetical protein